MRISSYSVCFCSVVLLGGCISNPSRIWNDNIYRMYTAEPLYTLDEGKGTIQPSILSVILKTKENPNGIVDESCYQPTSGQFETCRLQRDVATSTLMLASEEICVRHRRSIYGNEAAVNVFFGTFTSLFAGTAAVISPATSKSIFSALALFSNSERSLINETIYKQMLTTAIDRKIVTKRDESARAIHLQMQQPIDKYSVAQAMYAVSAFHNKCSFMEGLRYALIEGSGNPNARAADALKREISEVNLQLQLTKNDPILLKRREKLYDSLNELGAAVADTEPDDENVPTKK